MPASTLLDSLLSPADLRKMSAAQLVTLADEMRQRIKATVSAHGGHLASNLGVVELTLALHLVFDFSSDRVLWDVGHQAYPHKLLTGRAKQFHTNRQRGGISGFPDPKESPFDLAKVGHSSTAISTGVGIAEGYRRQSQRRKTVVVVGDGALTGGMAFEGLINAGELKSDLIVVLNDNGNFIDAPVGGLHKHLDRIRTGAWYQHLRERFMKMLRNMPKGDALERVAEQMETAAHKAVVPGFIFEDLGFTYFGPVDGHNLAETENLLRRISTLNGPILIHVMTKKGGGWAPSAHDPLMYHGPKGFDLESGEFHPKPVSGRTWSQVFADTLIDIAANDPSVVAITAAMPSGTGLRRFAQRFPDRMYDVGICEQHSFAFAQGLIVSGLKPVLAHYSTFAQRGYDQLFQEVVVQRDLGLVITLDRGGMVGEDGETHQGLYDIAWSRCFPGLIHASPRDGDELDALIRWAHEERQKSTRAAGYLIRYPRDEAYLPWSADTRTPITLGKAEVMQRGRGLMVWAYGQMVKPCADAIAELGTAGTSVTLVNARFAKPIDGDLLAELAADHDTVLTVEDHALAGGFGTIVAETVSDRDLALRVVRAGVRDELVAHATRAQQLADHGLDGPGLTRRLRRLLGLEPASIPFARVG